MTAQIPDVFVNERDFAGLEDYHLYFIAVGDVRTRDGWRHYEPRSQPDEVSAQAVITSLNWKGWVGHYRLRADGRFVLEQYSYSRDLEPTVVNEVFEGDFYLGMRRDFYAPTLFVPFVDGRMVEDQSRWLLDGGRSFQEESLRDAVAEISHDEMLRERSILFELDEPQASLTWGPSLRGGFWMYFDHHLWRITAPWQALEPGPEAIDQALRELCVNPRPSPLAEPYTRLSDLCVHPSGEIMVACSARLRMWRLENMEEVMTQDQAWGRAHFTPDSALFVQSTQFCVVYSDAVRTLPFASRMQEGCFASHPAGGYLALAEHGTICIVSLPSGRPLKTWSEVGTFAVANPSWYFIRSMAFSPQGDVFAVASNQGLNIYRWADVLGAETRVAADERYARHTAIHEFLAQLVESWIERPTVHRSLPCDEHSDYRCLHFDAAHDKLLFVRRGATTMHAESRKPEADEIRWLDVANGEQHRLYRVPSYADNLDDVRMSIDGEVLGCELGRPADTRSGRVQLLQLLDYAALARRATPL